MRPAVFEPSRLSHTVPDFEGAQAYVLRRLEHELSPKLTYHNLFHTRDDVVPATERLALYEGVTKLELQLLLTAAWYHDLGFVENRLDHEAIGMRLAQETLPAFGFNQAQVRLISGIILATKLPQNPHNHLEEIVADADLDVLGREDFWPRNLALRAEVEAYTAPYTDDAWYRSQLRFIHSHHYFTKGERVFRDAGKQANMLYMAKEFEKSVTHSSV